MQPDPMSNADNPAIRPMSNAQAKQLADDLWRKRMDYAVSFDRVTGRATVTYQGKEVYGGAATLTGQTAYSDAEGGGGVTG